MFADSTEYFFNHNHVLFKGSGVDRDIVQVDMHAFANHVVEDVVHDSLKCRGGVAKSKRHADILVLTQWGDECSNFLCALTHTELMISCHHVKGGENARITLHLFEDVLRIW